MKSDKTTDRKLERQIDKWKDRQRDKEIKMEEAEKKIDGRLRGFFWHVNAITF